MANIAIQLGPYRILSDDPYLSRDDVALNTQSFQSVTLDSVGEYVGVCSFTNQLDWMNGLYGGESVNLTQFQQMFSDECVPTSELICTGQKEENHCAPEMKVSTELCTVNIGGFTLPVKFYYGPLCQGSQSSVTEDFILKFGGRIIGQDSSWQRGFSNCHAYALKGITGMPPSITFDEGRYYYLSTPLEQPDMVRLVPKIDKTLETLFSNFAHPVGFIPSSKIEVGRIANLIALYPEGAVDYLAYLDRVLGLELDKLSEKGALTSDSLNRGEYIVVFSGKVNFAGSEGEEPYIIVSQHSGILRRENDRWLLEAKLSHGQDVIVSPLAPQLIAYYVAHLEAGFTGGGMFVRIYQAGQGSKEAAMVDLKGLISAEPAGDHPVLFRKLDVPKAAAAEILKDF